MTLFRMTMAALVLAAMTSGAAVGVQAEESCGDPCPRGQYWTDRGGGKCLPAPQGEAKTS